jgi:Uncharacterized conserved protein
MTDDKINNPCTPSVPVEEKTQKLLPSIVAKRWCSCMFFASAMPLILAVFACFMEAVFGGTWQLDNGIGYDLLGLICFSALFVGFPASIVALFLSRWQQRLKLAFASLVLMVCNPLLFAYTFWALIAISC